MAPQFSPDNSPAAREQRIQNFSEVGLIKALSRGYEDPVIRQCRIELGLGETAIDSETPQIPPGS